MKVIVGKPEILNATDGGGSQQALPEPKDACYWCQESFSIFEGQTLQVLQYWWYRNSNIPVLTKSHSNIEYFPILFRLHEDK